MSTLPPAYTFMAHEARALLTRLESIKSFAECTPTVPAASLTTHAQGAIDRQLDDVRTSVRGLVHKFLDWLATPAARETGPARVHEVFALLRLRFNDMLTQIDIFADILNQRSESETGVWISGLDLLAEDALRFRGPEFDLPPLICYLDRGHGAAIRRARTRLPGGGDNPVGVIRIPRERMVGAGIGSSLIHEVGHQGASILDLVKSIRSVLQAMQKKGGPEREAWLLYERWISEILSDFWAVAKLGVSATMGLIGVVSLPRVFVFRLDLDDPHPMPWYRVKISAALGDALFPNPQWRNVVQLWETLYPIEPIDPTRRAILKLLEDTLPTFTRLVVEHRPARLKGLTLQEAIADPSCKANELRRLFINYKRSPISLRTLPPTLVMAIIGQARFDGQLSPHAESALISRMLRNWALADALRTSHSTARDTTRQRNTLQLTLTN